MSGHATTIPDAPADRRWLEWQTRGNEGDRRRALRVGTAAVLMAVGLTFWLFVQLA